MFEREWKIWKPPWISHTRSCAATHSSLRWIFLLKQHSVSRNPAVFRFVRNLLETVTFLTLNNTCHRFQICKYSIWRPWCFGNAGTNAPREGRDDVTAHKGVKLIPESAGNVSLIKFPCSQLIMCVKCLCITFVYRHLRSVHKWIYSGI